MVSRLLSWLSSVRTPVAPAPPAQLPRSVRALSTDEQVRWAYRRFKPEMAVRIARGIRARAAASEGDKRPSIGSWAYEVTASS